MTYNLWDAEIGKYLGRYTSEDEALGVVRSLIDHYGDDYVESLSLGRVTDDGTVLEPITGSDLAARARTVTKRTTPRHDMLDTCLQSALAARGVRLDKVRLRR